MAESEPDIPCLDFVDLVINGSAAGAEKSDFKVKCKPEELSVHKRVLSEKSEILARICNDEQFTEANANVVSMTTHEPDAVRAMILFLYSGDYGNELALHAKVYALAEYYNIAELKVLAQAKFQSIAENHWDSAHFSSIISYIYASTDAKDRGLRDVVVELSKANLNKLLQKPQFEKLLEENGDFGKDVLRHFAQEPFRNPGQVVSNSYHCPQCTRRIGLWMENWPENNILYCPPCGSGYTWEAWNSQYKRNND